MRTEINVTTGEVVEFPDYPATPPTPPTVLEQIIAIETAVPFTHRHLRDITDLMVTALKQASETTDAMMAALKAANPTVDFSQVVIPPPIDLSQIPGIAAVAQVEAQIAALRSKL